MSRELYVGLMSGTSLDGADAALVDLGGASPAVLAHAHLPFPASLRGELLALNAAGPNELDRAARCANDLARLYAAATAAALAQARVPAGALRAIGCHGQTVRHRPDAGYTLQLGNAALLAELTGTRVVADFRSRDVAAGGQGAPLAPGFHAAVFGSADENRAVLNLGGIANLTALPANGVVTGFDSGPGNCLMDLWAQAHLDRPYDADGAWAAGAPGDMPLLERLLAEPYFLQPPPKSSGRDLFNEAWLRSRLSGGEDAQRVQATLLELTACSVADALRRWCPGVQRVIACGGGVRNRRLLSRLQELAGGIPVQSSDRYGIDPMQVEAVAFAWLAQRTLREQAGSLPLVTGARGARVLGAVYPP